MNGGGYRLAAVLGAILGVAALLISAAALGAAADDDGSGGASAAPAAQTIDVELGDFFIKPTITSVAPGTDVTLQVRNSGAVEHDLSVEGGPQTPLIAPGQTATLHLGNVDVAQSFFCSVPGHKEAGMQTALAVSESGAGGAEHVASVAATMTSEEMDTSYMAGIEAFPAATKGLGNQPLAPRIENGVKVFELTAAEIDWEVAPGEVHHGMAYNGMVPGPEIRVQLGDRVRIILHNNLNESTALHFHGLVVPNDMDGVPGLTQPLVEPGQSFTYEFTVRNAGSHMYHSHMHAEVQVPAGLLGAFVVAGPDEPQVSQDQVMVLNDGPLGFTINGKGFPATQPIVAKRGETVRIRYMNEGLQIHPMHLHGIPQTVIALDGNPVPQPYVQDTVLVAPGQRVDVVINASELGAWAFHCHILNHAERDSGMFGMVTVLLVH